MCLCVCVCVCPLSHWGTTASHHCSSLISRLTSPSSSRHAITLSNETGENASQAASILSPSPSHLSLSLSLPLCLSPVHSCLYPDWPVQYVAAGRMSVEGWREIGRQSYCHTVIGTKTWLILCLLLLLLPSLFLCLGVSLSQYNLLNLSLSINLSVFFFFLLLSLFLSPTVFLFYFYLCLCVAACVLLLKANIHRW